MADADLMDAGDHASPGARKCADCGEAVADELRYCPSCGRFVPGGKRRHARAATVAGVALWLALASLVVIGYVWVPVVGFVAEAVVWGYVILSGDWSVSGRRILVGTGIGLGLLAALAVVLRICGVGA